MRARFDMVGLFTHDQYGKRSMAIVGVGTVCSRRSSNGNGGATAMVISELEERCINTNTLEPKRR